MKLLIPPLSKGRLINSLKTAFSCLLGIIIGRALDLSMPQWILITIIVVMGANIRVGGTVKKSYLRLAGTALGAIVSAAILLLMHAHPILIIVLLLLMVAFFAYLASSSADLSQAGLLGAATMVMILGGRNPTLDIAVDRTAEIFLGIVIAIFVTRFIFPLHAKKLLYANLAKVIAQLKQSYELFTTYNSQMNYAEKQEQIEAEIIENLAKQNVLMRETMSEDYKFRQKQDLYKKILSCERKILRSNYILSQTLSAEEDAVKLFQHENFLKINQQVLSLFVYVNNVCLRQTAQITLPDKVMLHNTIETVFQEISQEMSHHMLLTTHAFLFCLAHLVDVLHDLIELLPQLYEV